MKTGRWADMQAADRLIRKAHDYEVLVASHSEREALVGAGSTSLLRLRSPSPRSSCVKLLPRSRTSWRRRVGYIVWINRQSGVVHYHSSCLSLSETWPSE